MSRWFTFSVAGLNIDPICKANIELIMQGVLNGNPTASVTVAPEPQNPYDPKAIRVDINGLFVGYVSKRDRTEMETCVPGLYSTILNGRVETWGQGRDNSLFCNVSVPF